MIAVVAAMVVNWLLMSNKPFKMFYTMNETAIPAELITETIIDYNRFLRLDLVLDYATHTSVHMITKYALSLNSGKATLNI